MAPRWSEPISHSHPAPDDHRVQRLAPRPAIRPVREMWHRLGPSGSAIDRQVARSHEWRRSAAGVSPLLHDWRPSEHVLQVLPRTNTRLPRCLRCLQFRPRNPVEHDSKQHRLEPCRSSLRVRPDTRTPDRASLSRLRVFIWGSKVNRLECRNRSWQY